MVKVKKSQLSGNVLKPKGISMTLNRSKKDDLNISGIKTEAGEATVTPEKVIKKKKGRNTKLKPKGVVYIQNIPHGFYETELQGFFGQFGKVTAVNLPRNKNDKSKGFAFVEFSVPEVAKIAAEAMHNYLMHNRLIKTKYIPPEEQKPYIFKRATNAILKNKTLKDKAEKRRTRDRNIKHKRLSNQGQQEFKKKITKKLESLKKKCAGLGVDFNCQIAGEIETVNLVSIKKLEENESPDGILKNTHENLDTKLNKKVVKSSKNSKKIKTLTTDDKNLPLTLAKLDKEVNSLSKKSKTKLKPLSANNKKKLSRPKRKTSQPLKKLGKNLKLSSSLFQNLQKPKFLSEKAPSKSRGLEPKKKNVGNMKETENVNETQTATVYDNLSKSQVRSRNGDSKKQVHLKKSVDKNPFTPKKVLRNAGEKSPGSLTTVDKNIPSNIKNLNVKEITKMKKVKQIFKKEVKMTRKIITNDVKSSKASNTEGKQNVAKINKMISPNINKSNKKVLSKSKKVKENLEKSIKKVNMISKNDKKTKNSK
uniref:RRM domain-containing protein n=1 Tax=Clastoptera arizonana TaxID=38151 RepID=A0A1B6CS60_9HEMI